jgi:hypothetical protein
MEGYDYIKGEQLTTLGRIKTMMPVIKNTENIGVVIRTINEFFS